MVNERRVVITGLGTVSPIGIGGQDFWDSLIKGKSGVGPISRFNSDEFDTKFAAEVKDFKVNDYMTRKDAKRMDRFSQYAIAAARQAVEDGNINLEKLDRENIGVILGVGIGGLNTFEEVHTRYLERGPSRVSPLFIPMMISNMAAGQISIDLGLKGSSMAITTACASGTHAIGEGFRMIKYGQMDMALSGGSEASITPTAFAGFNAMKALSTRNDDFETASRPFDKERDGFVMGEGAGILVLEELDHALERGAKIYGEIIGYGSSSDAFHITQPAADAMGPTKAMKAAIDEGKIDYQLVDYINAHGTSTYYNDMLETLAIKNLFKDHAYKLNISSTKSMTGHLLGAAGAVEAVASLLALKESIIPPTINYENPDEECDLNYTVNKAVEKELSYALSNSLGFGGHNASLLFKKYED